MSKQEIKHAIKFTEKLFGQILDHWENMDKPEQLTQEGYYEFMQDCTVHLNQALSKALKKGWHD